MTIARSTLSKSSPAAAGLWPYRNGSSPAPEPIDIPQADDLLSAKAASINRSAPGTVSFGPFRLLLHQRLLLEGDTPLRIGSRALDILIALLERPGELVSKKELHARVWPDTHVVDGNLKFQVAALRRALGDGRDGRRYLVTAPGRGYGFVAPVRAEGGEVSSPSPPEQSTQHNLPACLTRLVGRADVIGKLAEQLSRQRLLTIVGPGGIGKSSLALAVAEQLIGGYEHGIWLADLAPLDDPELVPNALAAAIGLEVRSHDPVADLTGFLQKRRVLLVLDNCAHVIEAAAALAVRLLRGAPDVRILATSREPLRVCGEHIHRLTPLQIPPNSAHLSAAEALRFPAVQLFVAQAAASLDWFELTDAEAPSVAEICRKLDGIPLAIEFAAARVGALGVRGLASRLEDCLRLPTGSPRAVPPRHQTMSAALDWSYGLLSELGQRVFRRLSIFSGGFTLQAAVAIAGDPEYAEGDITEQVLELIAKSLVAEDVRCCVPRYRLLETTRAYALEKLSQSEFDTVARHRAEYYRDLLEAAGAARGASVGAREDDTCTHEIHNIRAGLAWAFGPGGSAATAVTLAAASASLWLEMSLLAECREWTGKALDLLGTEDRGTRREMVLQTAFGLSQMFTGGMSDRARTALARASELAEGLHDLDYQLRALSGLAVFCFRLEDAQGALAFARRCEAAAKAIADPVAMSTATAMLAASHFFLGEYAEALTCAQRAGQGVTPAIRQAQIARFGMDYSIWSRCIVAEIFWLQGLLDQSAQAARDLLADAQASGHPPSLCHALASAGCRVPLGLGDLETAECAIAQLKELAEKHGLNSYYACALGFEGQICAKRGDFAAAERLLRSCLVKLRASPFENSYTAFLSHLAAVLAVDGLLLDDSHAAADEALQRTERRSGFWWMPEALRVKGEVLLLSNTENTTAAEDHFRRSLALARRQRAVSWELRSATNLARLLHEDGRTLEANDLLGGVYGRFREGFGAADLVAAKALLDRLRPNLPATRQRRPRAARTNYSLSAA